MTDLKPCRTCNNEVVQAARKCPQCGEVNPGVDMNEAKKNLLLISALLCGVVIVCVIIFG